MYRTRIKGVWVMGRFGGGGGGGRNILETEIGRLGPTNRVWKVYAEENDPCQCLLLGHFT